MKITDFLNNEYILYANYDNYQSIANYIDGMKPTARKLFYTYYSLKQKGKAKVAQLAAKMAEAAQYLSGEVSAQGVLVTISKDFKGSNNIPLFQPDGHFGSRFSPNSAASARYIYVYENKDIKNIFKEEDEEILIKQDFEGYKIEPRFYVPILPMILINGSEGIGNGFAQKILPRNPIEIKKQILSYLNGRLNNFNIIPWYKNYKGEILKNENSIEIKAKMEFKENKRGFNYFVIEDIPFNYSLNKFLKKLEDGIEKGIIQEYIDNSDNDEFYFEIKTKLNKDEILNKLGLIQKVTENFTCMNEINEIQEFENENELIIAYINQRLNFYDLRIKSILLKLKKDIEFYSDRMLFIKSILDDELIINKRKKQEILEDCEKLKIKFAEEHLRMNLLSLSSEKLIELNSLIDGLKEQEEYYNSITSKDLYIKDLKELKIK